jgi:hypothetical protein
MDVVLRNTGNFYVQLLNNLVPHTDRVMDKGSDNVDPLYYGCIHLFTACGKVYVLYCDVFGVSMTNNNGF